eukprot:TRINITY_DN18424_c0_g1_i1.p1 TRINITY_DN18424_c0_g1~~TRINITY_DN18424_c0_g1_i1.p1  ORF type:complete len:589 (-),score=184.56 TRINITY_DN18424_c0_g1_i1:12-1778(-)
MGVEKTKKVNFDNLEKCTRSLDSACQVYKELLQSGVQSSAIPFSNPAHYQNTRTVLLELQRNLEECLGLTRDTINLHGQSQEETFRRPTVMSRLKGKLGGEPKRVDWDKVPEEDLKTSVQSLAKTAVKVGFLTKRGGSRNNWRRRFVVLASNKIYYFKGAEDSEPQGVIPLTPGCTVKPVSKTECGKMHAFMVFHPLRRSYYMYAPNDAGRLEWLVQVQNCIGDLIERQINGEKLDDTDEEFGLLSKDGKSKAITLDDFQLLKVLGRGTYGKVVQARHLGNRNIYAIKIIKKTSLKEEVEFEHTRSEVKVLRYLRHPFIVGLKSAFQTRDKLYLVLDYVAGGDMYSLLKGQPIDISLARFFIAELVVALEHLHNHKIIYRDLKTENILLTTEGHICLTDFGLVKDNMDVGDKTSTICGTADTMAPEVVLGHEYGSAVDWWGVGCLLYEMLTGRPPFYSPDLDDQFDNILRCQPSFPETFPPDARDFISKLLVANPQARLGSGDAGAEDIKNHNFFSSTNFSKLLKKQVNAPLGFAPEVAGELDTSHFDPEFTSQNPNDSDDEPLDNSQNDEFQDFDFVDESLLEQNEA